MLALVCAGAATVDAGEARAVQLVQRSQRSLSTLPTLQRVNAAPRLDPAGNQLKATIATPASPSAENGPGILRRATVRVSGYAAPADCDDQLSDAEGLPKMPPADAAS
ncbi:MAG: hypothetical protein EHM42_13700, partial [Planctomycetaceae bacterium]